MGKEFDKEKARKLNPAEERRFKSMAILLATQAGCYVFEKGD